MKNVDTDPLRTSIWYYTHNILGYFHDHFDYRQVIKICAAKIQFK